VNLDDLKSLLQLILIEEFVLLNSVSSEKASENIILEFDGPSSPEQLGLLNGNLNAVCFDIIEREHDRLKGRKVDLYVILLNSELQLMEQSVFSQRKVPLHRASHRSNLWFS